MRLSLIAAVAQNGVIGRDNALIWHLPEDLRFFKATTLGCPVITGRRNYESLPASVRPLPGRLNVVVTRNAGYEAPGAAVVSGLPEAVAHAAAGGAEEAFVIGGGQLYAAALEAGMVDRMYLTHVEAAPEGDTFFHAAPGEGWSCTELLVHRGDKRHAHPFRICRYDRLK